MNSRNYVILLITSLLLAAGAQGLTVTGQFSTINGKVGANFEHIGTLNTNGTSSITQQLNWTRFSSALNNASFTISQGFKVSAISASVPNNSSSTNSLESTFTFGVYDGTGITTEIWTIGDELPEILGGVYAFEWFVPAKGQGGSSFAAGNASFNITVETVPESSTYALAAGIFVLALALYQRRKHI